MKRNELTLFICLLLGISIFVTSCNKNDIPEVTVDQVTLQVKVDDWDWVEKNNFGEGYYIAKKQVPELSNYIFNNGIITVYLVFDDGTKTALPYLQSWGYGEIDERKYFTEFIGYEFSIGEIAFFYELSDLQQDDDSLIDRTFEVRMVW